MEDEIFFSEEAQQEEKKVRHRKKRLYAAIKERLEFYLGDANLRKDRFLAQLVEKNKEVELAVFLKFNRIRELTESIQDLQKSIRISETLKLTEDLERVYRTKPVAEKDNIDDCTIYVEQLIPDADHDWLSEIFSKYGKVDYISIPKYKTSGKIKGFAFVEFEAPESARAAVEAFSKAGCCLTNLMDPSQLYSIMTFENESKDVETFSGQDNINQIKDDTDSHAKSETEVGEKRKITDDKSSESEPEEKKLKIDTEEAKEDSEVEKKDESGSKKKKKNRKKKKSHKQKYVTDLQSYGLQILPKNEWKRLRNKYLNLQRDKMKMLKQQLSRNNFKYQQRGERYNEMVPRMLKPKEGQEEAPSRFEMSPGLIVKVAFDQPIMDAIDVKRYRAEAKCLDHVVYIDFKVGQQDGYIRMDSAKSAQEMVISVTRPWEHMTVIAGEEEERYWEVMKRDREEKIVNKIRISKRGRNKQINKAEKLISKKIRLSVDE